MSSLDPLRSVQGTPVPPPVETDVASAHQGKITQIAFCALQFVENMAFHTGLLIVKIIVIPIECSLLVIVATATALSILFSCPCTYTFEEGMQPTLFHHCAAFLDEICQVIRITFNYGIVCNHGGLQNADDAEGSPQFVLIQPRSQTQSGTNAPILYAPGYLDTPETLLETCGRLADACESPVYLVKYRSLFQSIEEHARDVERVAERIFRDSQQFDLVLAGHSMGGLVTGRYILQSTNEQVNVKLWITIGSPLQGTPLAHLGIGECARQMRPNSETIHLLQESQCLDVIPSLHIYSLTDHIVPSPSAQRRDSPLAENHLCTRPLGHIGIRACSETEHQIVQAIHRQSEQSPS